MRFAIAPTAMNASEAVLNKLDAVLRRIEDDIHELEIVDADLLEETIWYQSCRFDRRDLLKKCAASLLHKVPRSRGPHMRRFEVIDEGTASTALASAYTPLRVLVENMESDGALVKFALMIFATSATWDLCYGAPAGRTPPAFEVESRGGAGELRKLIVDRVKEAQSRGLAPRLVAMTDSDGEWVGDVKAHAKAIHDECAAHGVPCPPLTKRTVENYIPEAVWSVWSADRQRTAIRPAVEALLRLTGHQRDHVKFGPSNTPPWSATEPNVARLFAGVSVNDQHVLSKASLKVAAATAIVFVLEGKMPTLTRADVETRDPAGDLNALARCIEDGL